jgi:glycine cleavage system H lipoate-binding protein
MSNIPSHLQYTESHEWVSTEDDGGQGRIGYLCTRFRQGHCDQ